MSNKPSSPPRRRHTLSHRVGSQLLALLVAFKQRAAYHENRPSGVSTPTAARQTTGSHASCPAPYRPGTKPRRAATDRATAAISSERIEIFKQPRRSTPAMAYGVFLICAHRCKRHAAPLGTEHRIVAEASSSPSRTVSTRRRHDPRTPGSLAFGQRYHGSEVCLAVGHSLHALQQKSHIGLRIMSGPA